jgi:hypothetical protein
MRLVQVRVVAVEHHCAVRREDQVRGGDLIRATARVGVQAAPRAPAICRAVDVCADRCARRIVRVIPGAGDQNEVAGRYRQQPRIAGERWREAPSVLDAAIGQLDNDRLPTDGLGT